MLGIDHQHGRFRSDEPGADSGVSGRQRRGAVCRARARGSVRLGGAERWCGTSTPAWAEPDKGLVRRYLARMTGLSRAQVTRLIAGYRTTGRVKAAAYQRTKFATRYTAADVELLAYVDKAHGNLSGPATDGSWSASTTNTARPPTSGWRGSRWRSSTGLRNSAAYRKRNTSYQPTRPTPIPIGERRKPQPQRPPGYLRIDTVHQGDQDGRKGMYHINAVDEVTQWEIVAATPQISELWLIPVLEAMLEQFPFVIRGFHSDNGSEFINYTVARLLDKLLIEQTKSRAHHSGDNGLVESQERSHHPQAHRIRPHRRATRRGGGPVPSPAPEPVRQLPSSLRRAQDRHRSQRQAAPGLPAMGHALRALPGSAALRRAYCGPASRWRNWNASPRVNPIPKPRSRCSAPNENCSAVSEPNRSHENAAPLRLPLVGDPPTPLIRR